jgi:hypothetical protein
VNYRDATYPLEIITVDMLKGLNGEDFSSLHEVVPTKRLTRSVPRPRLSSARTDVPELRDGGSTHDRVWASVLQAPYRSKTALVVKPIVNPAGPASPS